MSLLGLITSEITPLLVGLRVTEYALAGSAALWAHEYLLTLDREVALVWRSPWSFGKVMFFLNRYTPIIDILLWNAAPRTVSNLEECRMATTALSWFTVTGVIWSEIILTMRAWAIWGATRHMSIFLTIFIACGFIAGCFLIQRVLKTIVYISVPSFLIQPVGVTCTPLPKHAETWPLLLVYMTTEAVVTSLALYRGFQRYRITDNPLLTNMFHDGLLYYLYTLALTTTNLFVVLFTPIQWGFLIELPLRVVISIFSTRVLLNIRGSYFESSATTDGTNPTTFKPRTRSTLDASTTLPTVESMLDDEEPIEEQGWTWNSRN